MTAQLIDLGNSKVNKTVVVKNEKALHKEIQKYLFSKGWGMYETNEPDVWEIEAGFRVVGKVKILEV